MIRTLILVALVSQCPGGRCPAQSPAIRPQQYQLADSSGQAWTSHDPAWLSRWVAQRNAEIAGQKPEPEAGPKLPTGVEESKIPVVPAEGYYGGNVGASAPHEDVKSKKDRLHLTVIGPGAAAAVQHWRTDPAFEAIQSEMGDRLCVQNYPSLESPMIRGLGFTAGTTLQLGDGKVVVRWLGSPSTADVTGEIRKADPRRNPSKDRLGGGYSGQMIGGFADVEIAAMVAIGLCVFLILRRVK